MSGLFTPLATWSAWGLFRGALMAVGGGVGLLGIATRLYSRASHRWGWCQIEAFTHVPHLGMYLEAGPRVSLGPGKSKAPHAILLVHGYSASPATFDTLTTELDRREIPYYAPILTGFGQDSLALLTSARAEDWRRDVQMAYNLLTAWAERVSVVGMSFGALLALDLASRNPVAQLVLASPYLTPRNRRERMLAQVFKNRLLAYMLEAALPFFPKPHRAGRATSLDVLDPEKARSIFHYHTLPLHSLREMTRFRSNAAIDTLLAESVLVVYGGRDETADVPDFLTHLTEKGIAHQVRCYDASDHGVLEDYDRVRVSNDIVAFLIDGGKQPAPSPSTLTSEKKDR